MSSQLYAQTVLDGQTASASKPVAPKPFASSGTLARVDFASIPLTALTDILRAQLVVGMPVQSLVEPQSDVPPAEEVSDPEFVAACLGCLGGIAADVMAPRNATSLAVIGTGPTAEAQIQAAIAVRAFTQIRLYGRQPVAAAKIEKKFRNSTTATITVCATPEIAVHHADVVILASNQAEMVIDADWVAPHAHVTAIIMSEEVRQPLPKGLLQRARTVASDDPESLAGKVIRRQDLVTERVLSLGELIDQFNPDANRAMTVFISSNPATLANSVRNAVAERAANP